MRHVHLRLLLLVSAMCLLMSAPANCATASLSLTGSLPSPQSAFQQTFTLDAPATLRIVTWSFGGGTNAAGQVIPAGGFDPLVALFSGPPTPSIVLNAGIPAADADTLTNFVGNCPPAGTVMIGTGVGSAVCGDDALVIMNVPAGIYTLVLTDANYIPFAVDPGPPTSSLLSDGFLDLTAGVFQTCNTTSNGTTCITPANRFAVDIVDTNGVAGGGGLMVMPQTVTKAFDQPQIELFFGTANMSITISNPNTALTLTGVSFTDILPGLTVSSPENGLTNTCGGTAIAAPDSGVVSLQNGTLGPGAACELSVRVNGAAIGVQTNVVAVTSLQGGTSAPAMATISVVPTEFLWFFGEGGGGRQ
jgi:hypothetical protein